MTTPEHVWGVWDCQELISLHITLDDAHEALEQHLTHCQCFADQQDMIRASTEIRRIHLPADSGVWLTGAGEPIQAIMETSPSPKATGKTASNEGPRHDEP